MSINNTHRAWCWVILLIPTIPIVGIHLQLTPSLSNVLLLSLMPLALYHSLHTLRRALW